MVIIRIYLSIPRKAHWSIPNTFRKKAGKEPGTNQLPRSIIS